jgi:cyclopropane-fatty-acyl-phospholipid synthase
MLALTAKRARLADGQRILDLGCGWGSFGLYAAQTYPGCSVLAVSNSATQGAYIRDRARELGLANIEVATADMNAFDPGDTAPFDRVVSVEMFEHMRNWGELLRRISTWLAPSGKCFVHVFAHRELVYPFREGPGEWMSRYFFAGGVMPADALLLHLQRDMVVEDHWRVDGRHYARTLDSWLALLDGRRERIMSIMTETYGATEPAVWLQRWRMFMMACSELFGYRGGSEWLVSHYRLGKRGQS